MNYYCRRDKKVVARGKVLQVCLMKGCPNLVPNGSQFRQQSKKKARAVR